MARLEFSRKTKKAIIDRAAGNCEKCKAVLKPGEGEVDHILPCAPGGEPTVANGRLICRQCHKDKTAADVRQIRKSDRQRDNRRDPPARQDQITRLCPERESRQARCKARTERHPPAVNSSSPINPKG